MFIILNKFLNRMRHDLGSWEQLRPAPRAYAELDASKGTAVLLQSTLALIDKLSEKMPAVEQASAAAAERTVAALCVRLNSLQFCLAELRQLSKYIDTHWAALTAHSPRAAAAAAADATAADATAAADAGGGGMRTILHDEAPHAVQATIDEMAT
eukprot:3172628-Prymnesium_polylepis.1